MLPLTGCPSLAPRALRSGTPRPCSSGHYSSRRSGCADLTRVRAAVLEDVPLEVLEDVPLEVLEDAPLVPVLPTVGDEVSPILPPETTEAAQTTTYSLSKKLSTADYPGLAPKAPPPAEGPSLPDLELPDLPDLSSAGDAVAKAAADAQAAVSALTGDFGGAVSGFTDSLSSGISGGLSGVTGSVTGGLSGITGGLTGAASGLTGAVGEGLSGVTGSVTSRLSGLTGSVGGATEGVSKLLDENTQAAREVLGSAASSVSGAVDGITAAASGTISSIQGAADSTLSAAAQASEQVLSSLPPEAREALEVAAQGAGAAAALAASHPAEASAVAGLAVTPLLIGWYSERFAGYAGELDPVEVRSLLVGDKAVLLVDIREENDREAAGVPELKLGARYKATSLPLSVTEPLLFRQAADRQQHRLAVAAALIAGQKQLKSSLDVVVIMDSRGDKVCKELARALRTEGVFQAYVMKGGFNGWVSADLPVDESAEYQAGAAVLLKDEIEVVTAKVNEVWSEVSKPQVGIPLLGVSVVAATAIINYHTTLQVIGLWGTAFSIYNGSALAFLKGAASGAAGAAATVSSMTKPKAKPAAKPVAKAALKPRAVAPAPEPVAVVAAIEAEPVAVAEESAAAAAAAMKEPQEQPASA